MKDEHGKQRALDGLQERAQTAISLKAHYANGTLSAAQVLAILDAAERDSERLRGELETLIAEETNTWRTRIQKAAR